MDYNATSIAGSLDRRVAYTKGSQARDPTCPGPEARRNFMFSYRCIDDDGNVLRTEEQALPQEEEEAEEENTSGGFFSFLKRKKKNDED